jgi:hypothetical protein
LDIRVVFRDKTVTEVRNTELCGKQFTLIDNNRVSESTTSSTTQPPSQNSRTFRSCDDFVNYWLENYQYARQYRAYECESTNINNASFVIFGKPGTLTTDQWFYQPQTQTILHLNPNTSYGMKAQTVYKLTDFSIISTSESQGVFASPKSEAAQRATAVIVGDYCYTQGGPPLGCGLTLADCNKLISRFPGMYCVRR